MGRFRKLLVYRRAMLLSDELHGAVRKWEKVDQWTVGVQLLRAADSIGANIAEAHGRDGPADRRRFLFIARGSACELEYWLDRAERRNLPSADDAINRAEEVARLLNGLIRSWR